MMEMDLAGQLENLFHEVGEAHHQAYIETDGADPEWPLWYADYCGRISVCSSTPASPRASSSTCSSWSQTSSRSRPLVPTGQILRQKIHPALRLTPLVRRGQGAA